MPRLVSARMRTLTCGGILFLTSPSAPNPLSPLYSRNSIQFLNVLIFTIVCEPHTSHFYGIESSNRCWSEPWPSLDSYPPTTRAPTPMNHWPPAARTTMSHQGTYSNDLHTPILISAFASLRLYASTPRRLSNSLLLPPVSLTFKTRVGVPPPRNRAVLAPPTPRGPPHPLRKSRWTTGMLTSPCCTRGSCCRYKHTIAYECLCHYLCGL
jgi:hypothetical protein